MDGSAGGAEFGAEPGLEGRNTPWFKLNFKSYEEWLMELGLFRLEEAQRGHHPSL